MVDYFFAEIGAIEERFPESMVYICDSHRIQALKRWARASCVFLGKKEEMTEGRKAGWVSKISRTGPSP